MAQWLLGEVRVRGFSLFKSTYNSSSSYPPPPLLPFSFLPRLSGEAEQGGLCTRRGKSLNGPEQVSEFSKENAAHTQSERIQSSCTGSRGRRCQVGHWGKAEKDVYVEGQPSKGCPHAVRRASGREGMVACTNTVRLIKGANKDNGAWLFVQKKDANMERNKWAQWMDWNWWYGCEVTVFNK